MYNKPYLKNYNWLKKNFHFDFQKFEKDNKVLQAMLKHTEGKTALLLTNILL